MSANFPYSGSRNHFSRAGLTAAVLAATAFGAAPAARADVHVGVSVGLELPHGYAEVRVGRDRYFEHRGVFYRHGPHGYVVVRAPRGANVRTLPPYYTRISTKPRFRAARAGERAGDACQPV